MAGRKPSKRRRRQGRLTREGKAFVLVSVGVGIAAVNTGNNLLYLMLGLMLSILLLSMVLSETALWRIRVGRSTPRRAFAGEECLIDIRLSNEKRWMPSFSLEVEDQATGEPTKRRSYFLRVGAQGQQDASYRRTPRRRGLLRFGGFRVTTRYPFGLVEKTRLLDSEGDLLVYPALQSASTPRPRSERGRSARAPLPQKGVGTEVSGIREYRPFDEARSIHWRRTASLGRLIVRETDRETARRLTVVLDNARPEGASEAWDDAFEAAISRAASVATQALTHGLAIDIVSRGGRSPVVSAGMPPDPLLRFLALLDSVQESSAPPLETPRGAIHEVGVVRDAEPDVGAA